MYSLRSVQFLVLLVVVLCCGNPQENKATVKNIDTKEAKELLDKGHDFIVLDVRTPEEFNSGHIEGAVNINVYDDDFSGQVDQLDKDKTYIVHCAANVENGRSAKSIGIMVDLGFKNIMSMDGGFTQWQSEGLAVENE